MIHRPAPPVRRGGVPNPPVFLPFRHPGVRACPEPAERGRDPVATHLKSAAKPPLATNPDQTLPTPALPPVVSPPPPPRHHRPAHLPGRIRPPQPGRSPSETRRACPEPVEGNHTHRVTHPRSWRAGLESAEDRVEPHLRPVFRRGGVCDPPVFLFLRHLGVKPVLTLFRPAPFAG